MGFSFIYLFIYFYFLIRYVHTADMNRATQTILLNGITLNSSEFIILYDSTPYASKGHIALNLPCDS